MRRYCPELAPWVDLCYGRESVIWFGDRELVSGRGVQQGDPLGPALFAMAIQPVIERARAEVSESLPGELDWVAFFLDDGFRGFRESY